MQKAADGGLFEARYALGELYFLGDDLQPKDRAKGVGLLKPLAEAGDAKAQNIMGVATRDGLGGLTPDRAAAEEWFRKAALQNEKKAQSNLGHLLGVPIPSNPNRIEALKWLILSSEQGEITAKKTLDELRPNINALFLLEAQKQANEFQKTQTK
jgi:hypothetical protein